MARFRWIVLVLWLVIVIASAVLLVPKASSVTKSGGFTVGGSNSDQATTILETEFSSTGGDIAVVVFHSDSLTVDDEEFERNVVLASDGIEKHPHVGEVQTYYNTFSEQLVTPSRNTTIALVSLEGTDDEIEETIPEIREQLEGLSLDHYVTGSSAVDYDTFLQSEQDLKRSEFITIPIVVILLLIVFRTVIAATIPLIVGVSAVIFALSILYGAGHLLDTSIFALNVASMIGLGLGIDFSLIVVSRFREERRRGRDRDTAIAVTMATAGRSITYSAITVILSMSVLTIILYDLMLVRSISLGVLFVAVSGLIVGLTILPALLALLDYRLEWLRILPKSKNTGDHTSGIWYRFSHAIMRHPWPYMTAGLIILLMLAAPARNLELIGASTGALPPDMESVVGAELLAEEYGDHRLSPIQVVVKGDGENSVWTPEFLTAIDDFTNALEADRRVAGLNGLAETVDAVPRDGRFQNLQPGDFDPAPQIDETTSLPIIPGATVDFAIIATTDSNPLTPPSAPTFVGLGRFALEPGTQQELQAAQALNVMAVEGGELTVIAGQPTAFTAALDKGNAEAVQLIPADTPIVLTPFDQLVIQPNTPVTIESSETAGAQFVSATMFVVRSGSEPQGSWGVGTAVNDPFFGIPRQVLGSGVAEQITDGPLSIRLERITSEPGAYIQRHYHSGPTVIAVEEGVMTLYGSPETAITSPGGIGIEVPEDAPVELDSGGNAFIQAGGIHRFNNLSEQPSAIYALHVDDAAQSPILLPGVQESVAQYVNLDGANNVTVIDLVTFEDEHTEEHQSLIFDIRDNIVPQTESLDNVEVFVGGTAAKFVDFRDTLYGRFLIIVLSVALINFIILMMFFQSIVLPIKAIFLNLLGIGATIGVLVMIFQWGWGTSVLGFEAQGFVSVVTPVILYVILFALSTDYEVFMLSRVKEIYHELGDNEEAVAQGLEQTAGVITAAGLILVFTFGSFAMAQVVTIKEIGLGLAIAVLIDSTLIRIILVPATMRLMGDLNWWMPEGLKRFVPEISEGPAPGTELVPAGAAAMAGGGSQVPAGYESSSWMGSPSHVSPAPAFATGIQYGVARLRPTTANLGVDVIPLSPTHPFTIGRHESNVLHLYDVRVSRYHARIEANAFGQYIITDLNSSNGVYVNGHRIAPEPNQVVLHNGDTIEIGNIGIGQIVFEQGSAAQSF